MICAKSTAPDHSNLEVVVFPGASAKCRKTYMLTGLSPKVRYNTYDNSIVTLERAVKERVFFVKNDGKFVPPPHAQPGAFDKLNNVLKFFRTKSFEATALTAQQFVDTCPPSKRVIYTNAMNSLTLNAFKDVDAQVKCFVKYEKYDFSTQKVPVPRIIQPRDPRFNLMLGRRLRPIEKYLYKVIDALFASPTVMKGRNEQERGRIAHEHYQSFDDCAMIGLDAKRFDQHVNEDLLRFEHKVYRMFYRKDKTLSRLLKLQLKNIARGRTADGQIKYTKRGGRMSGDVNTSLGNILIMCILSFSYLSGLEIKFKMMNDGDDGVVFLERNDVPKFQSMIYEFFLEFGIEMEIEEPVYVLEKMIFCQSQPVLVGDSYVMVRDPRKAISKDCVACKPLDNGKVIRMWYSAVGSGGLSMNGKVPVWQDFYALIIRASMGSKPLTDSSVRTGVYYRGRGMNFKYGVVQPQTRMSFYLAFGIPPDAQIAIEDYYRTSEITVKCEGAPDSVTLPYLE